MTSTPITHQSPSAIEVQHLCHDYGTHTVLRDISLNIPKGSICAFIGPNGAGKSTLLNLIARLETLQQGTILIDGHDIAKTPTSELATKVAILQQQTTFLSRLSIEDLLLFARYPYHKGRPRPDDIARVNQICDYFQLQDTRHRFVDELSGGQRQRALVAMVFCQDTDLILLDEPLNNLDVYHAKHLMQLLKQAVHEWQRTIVIVLHDINYASTYADTIVALKHGEIAAVGPTEHVIDKAHIENIYDVTVDIIEHNNQRICIHF